MQLSQWIFCAAGLFLSFHLAAQNKDTSKIKLDDIEVTFLMSYYEQDGNNSAVTGGRGTEQLTNFAPSLTLYIPLDTVRSITLDGGVDFYSSASSDNINNPYLNPDHVSGASAKDQRVYATLGYKKKNYAKHFERTLYAGFSSEFDVQSISFGGSILKSTKDNNKSLGLKALYFYDIWKLIYPSEFRNGSVAYLENSTRQSVNLSATGAINLNRKINASLTGDLVFQSGLLSTPFHRVYVQGSDVPKVEQLPTSRIKTPVGLRVNIHITDFLIAKTFYRYYWDDWNLSAHTMKLTLPIKINQALRVYPFARYHYQIGTSYFQPYNVHLDSDIYFTSDYDLSSFSSIKYGVGLSIDPLFGLARFKRSANRLAIIKTLDLRYARYNRSDGLNAGVFTLAIKSNIQQ